MNKLNLKSVFILLLILSLAIPVVEAQKPITRQQALNVMLRTNRVIGLAHMVVKKGKVYTGNLGKAVRHERYAKKLFNSGNYLRCIHFSRRARILAVDAIKANKGKPSSDATETPEEKQLAETVPSDQELEDELKKENVAEIKDEDLITNNNLDIDVK